MRTLKLTDELLDLADQVVKKGNVNAVSDAGVAALQAEAAATGAYFNVRINLPQIDDDDYKSRISDEAETLVDTIRKKSLRIGRRVKKQFQS